jgi:trigger factor
MSVTLENLDGLERKLTITIPNNDIEQEVEKRLHDMAKNKRFKMDGFRAGGNPALRYKAIKQRFGKSIASEAVAELIERNYKQALEDKAIKPADRPAIDTGQYENGQDLTFHAKFEIYPEFELKPFSQISVERKISEVGDAEIDDAILRVREQLKTWQAIDSGIEAGDRVALAYIVQHEGKEIQEESRDKQSLDVGRHVMHEAFETGLIGLKAGDEKVIAVTLPEDYYNESLRGKTVDYHTTIHKVERSHLPELDEALIKKAGVKAGTQEALREEVRVNLQRELRYLILNHVKNEVFGKLLEAHEFALPQSMVEQEAARIRDQNISHFKSLQPNMNIPEIPLSTFLNEAEKRVKLGLIMSHVMEKHELKPDNDRIEARIQDMAKVYDDHVEAAQWIKSNKQQMNQLIAEVLDQQIVDLILADATVTELKVPFSELTKAVTQSR